MSKIKQILKPERGSIIVFVLISITVLGAILIPLLERTRCENLFYDLATKSYGFFDNDGELRGLVETEAESMSNLIHAALYNYAKQIKDDPTVGEKLFEASNEGSTGKIINNEKFGTVENILNELKFSANVNHNTGIVAEVAVLSGDDRLPFTKKFGEEVKNAINAVLVAKKFDSKKIDEFLRDVNAILNGKHDFISVIQSTDDFIMLSSWQTLVGKDSVNAQETDAEKTAKAAIDKCIVFSNEVEAVNFFMADVVVQKIICDGFIKDLTKEDKQNIKTKLTVKDEDIKFVFDDNDKLNFAGNSHFEKVNKELLNLMVKKGFAIDVDSSKYEDFSADALSKWKVIMCNETKKFKSHSCAFEVKIYVYDKDFKAVSNSDGKYFCHSYK